MSMESKSVKQPTSELVLKGAEGWLITALEAKVIKKGMKFNLIPKNQVFNATEQQMGFGCGAPGKQKVAEEKFMEYVNDKEKQKEISIPFLHISNSILTAFLNRYNTEKLKELKIFNFQLTGSGFVIRKNEESETDELTMEFYFKF